MPLYNNINRLEFNNPNIYSMRSLTSSFNVIPFILLLMNKRLLDNVKFPLSVISGDIIFGDVNIFGSLGHHNSAQSRNQVISRFFQGHNDAHLTDTCEVRSNIPSHPKIDEYSS